MKRLSLSLGSPARGDIPSALLSPREFVSYATGFSCEEVGGLIEHVLFLLHERRFRELEAFPFIGRIFVGTKKRKHIPTDIRRRVLSSGICAICGSSNSPEIDHIIPVIRGGTDDEINLRRLCKPCNLEKGARL